ncbi:MAG TPA: PilZ domain-containing protein [Vicinamibacterales bacterium]|nr:PilZ domain-containing protein [Vicinamibacterales bacterium]
MVRPLTERRAHSRFGHPTISPLQAVLRPGHAVSVVNLSAGGALLDGPRPLRPGSRVFLQVTVAGQTGGRTAHVLRCTVASLENQTGVQYRSAIAFDNHWESLWEHCTLRGYRMPMLLDHFEMVDGHFLPGGTEPLAPESEDGPR